MILSLANWLVLNLAMLVFGWWILRARDGPLELKLCAAWCAGQVVFHLILQAMDLAGLMWTRTGVLTVVVGFLCTGALVWRGGAPPAAEGSALPWLVALPPTVVFLWAAVSLRSTASDFVYHWGIKGKRFAGEEGIDWAYLKIPENGFAHPDYPMLVSEQFSALALLTGGFVEPVQMLWSVLSLFLLLAVAAGSLLRSGLSRWSAVLGGVGLGAGISAFCVGYYQAGGADLHIALALTAGAALLHFATSEEMDRGASAWDGIASHIGWISAFAMSSKIEGGPLAVVLVVLWGWGRLGGWNRLCGRASWPLPNRVTPVLAAVFPALVSGGLWWVLARTHDLFQPTNLGSPNPFRWPIIQEHLLAQLALPEWHRLTWILFALPLLFLVRASRPFALLAAAQFALYVVVYVSAPVDPVYWIVSSFPRALLQFLPAVGTGLLVAAGHVDSGQSGGHLVEADGAIQAPGPDKP